MLASQTDAGQCVYVLDMQVLLQFTKSQIYG